MSHTATILLVMEDLLAAWLRDGLIAADHQVHAVLPEEVDSQPWTELGIDMIIGELRYPVESHFQILMELRERWPSPLPMLLVGTATSTTHLPDDPGVAWMPAPLQRDAVVELVNKMLQQRMSSPAGASLDAQPA